MYRVRVWACMHVLMCPCMCCHAHVPGGMYSCMRVHTHTYVCMCSCVYLCLHSCACICGHSQFVPVCACAHVCVCDVCLCVHVFMCLFVDTHLCSCVCMFQGMHAENVKTSCSGTSSEEAHWGPRESVAFLSPGGLAHSLGAGGHRLSSIPSSSSGRR